MNRQDLKNITVDAWLRITGIVMQLVIGVSAAVWLVSEMNSTTGQLQGTIGNLTGSVDKLNETVLQIQSTQFDHAARIRAMERHNDR